MIVDKFTKFILSGIAISLCWNTLNPWLSPALVNAGTSTAELQRTIDEIGRLDASTMY